MKEDAKEQLLPSFSSGLSNWRRDIMGFTGQHSRCSSWKPGSFQPVQTLSSQFGWVICFRHQEAPSSLLAVAPVRSCHLQGLSSFFKGCGEVHRQTGLSENHGGWSRKDLLFKCPQEERKSRLALTYWGHVGRGGLTGELADSVPTQELTPELARP